MLKRLPSSRYSTWTPSSWPMTRWKRQVMAERRMLKSTGAKTQPCLTPTFTSKDSDWSSPVSTLACIPSCSCCRMLRGFCWDAEFGDVFPEQLMVNGVKSFAEVDKGYVKVFVLFSALLQQLPQDKDHVCRGSGLPEATLGFRKHSFRDVLNQSAEHDLGQDFPCDEEERYPAAVTADCSVSFLLINDHDVSILPVLWEGPIFPDVLDQEVQTAREDVSSMLENLCRDSVGSSSFVVFQPCNGLPEFRVKWRRVQVLGWWQVW